MRLQDEQEEKEPQLSQLQARRRFMITDILSSVGGSGREEEARGQAIDMRILMGLQARGEGGEAEEEEGEGEEGRGELTILQIGCQ